jgi:hypothetical protein
MRSLLRAGSACLSCQAAGNALSHRWYPLTRATWGIAARVPLFAGLDAAAIADIMRLLRAQTVDAGDVIVRRGDNAHSSISLQAARSTFN